MEKSTRESTPGLKIALLGYGKMGKMVEMQALQRDHEVVLRIDPLHTPPSPPSQSGRRDNRFYRTECCSE